MTPNSDSVTIDGYVYRYDRDTKVCVRFTLAPYDDSGDFSTTLTDEVRGCYLYRTIKVHTLNGCGCEIYRFNLI